VTAVWGYSASPPEVVKQACCIQAVQALRRGQQMYATVNMAAAQMGVLEFAKDVDPEVRALLFNSRLVRQEYSF
jgi:hypothetical protein